MSADLLYSIGLDVSDLKTSAVAAKEQADEIKRGFKGFKDVLEAGGVAAAVFGFFSSTIDYAEQLKGNLDANEQAVRGFGSGLTSLKNTALDVGVKIIGTVNRLGEAIGDYINIVSEGWDSWADGQEKLEQTAAAAKSAQEALANSQKHAEEFKKVTEGILDIKKKEADLALQGITKQETLNNLTNEFLRLGVQLANGVSDQLEKRQLELKLAEARFNMHKAELDVRKEDADLAKKADEAESKALDETIKQFNALGEVKQKELAYARSKLSVEEQSQLLTDEKLQLEKILLDKNISLTKETETRQRLLEVTKQLDEFATDEASARLAEEKKITAEKKEQVEIVSRGQTYQSNSTTALEGTRARVASNLDAAIANDFGRFGGVGGGGSDPAIAQFRNDLAKIDAELALRRTVQSYANRFGEQAAIRQFGDEVTQRAFKDLADTSTRTTNAVETIGNTLTRVFGK
jgi:hypothetical protein